MHFTVTVCFEETRARGKTDSSERISGALNALTITGSANWRYRRSAVKIAERRRVSPRASRTQNIKRLPTYSGNSLLPEEGNLRNAVSPERRITVMRCSPWDSPGRSRNSALSRKSRDLNSRYHNGGPRNYANNGGDRSRGSTRGLAERVQDERDQLHARRTTDVVISLYGSLSPDSFLIVPALVAVGSNSRVRAL